MRRLLAFLSLAYSSAFGQAALDVSIQQVNAGGTGFNEILVPGQSAITNTLASWRSAFGLGTEDSPTFTGLTADSLISSGTNTLTLTGGTNGARIRLLNSTLADFNGNIAFANTATFTDTDLSRVSSGALRVQGQNSTSLQSYGVNTAGGKGVLQVGVAGIYDFSIGARQGTTALVFNSGDVLGGTDLLTLTTSAATFSVGGVFSSATSLLLGTAGSAVGSVGFRNATSGTATLAPPTGALGTYQVTLPNAASTLPVYGQQITYAGPTAARTVTFPDASFTVARTDAANAFTGASTASAWVLTSPTITTGIAPTTNDGAALGSTSNSFSDLFLASGALVNIANGNWVLTHSSAVAEVTTGDLRVTTAGTNAASVVTVGGTQTLTAKTLTAPVITSPQISLTAAHGSDDTYTGLTITGLNAGATIAQWEIVYLGGSSTWLLADANGSGTYPACGMAVAAYSNTNPATIIVRGTVRNDAWNFTPGGRLYLSTTAGGLTQTAPSASGDKVQDVGFALTADIAYLDFNGVYLTVQ